MNEREEMLSILSDLKEGSMTTNEAKKQLLELLEDRDNSSKQKESNSQLFYYWTRSNRPTITETI